MIAAALTAHAAPLVGVRSGPFQPSDQVGYGQVLVHTPDALWVTQGTLAAALDSDGLAVSGSIPWVLTGGEGLLDAGPGRVRGSLGAWLGKDRNWLLAGEVAINVLPGTTGVAAWGTRARDAVPGVDQGKLVDAYGPVEGPRLYDAVMALVREAASMPIECQLS